MIYSFVLFEIKWRWARRCWWGETAGNLEKLYQRRKGPFRKVVYCGLFFACTAVPTRLLKYLLSVIAFISKECQRQMSSGVFSCGRKRVAALLPTPPQGWRWRTLGHRAASPAVTAQLWPRYLPALSACNSNVNVSRGEERPAGTLVV